MNNTTIGFIGGGNMACSLIGGLIADGYDPQRIWVSDPDSEKCQRVKERFCVHTMADNVRVVQEARIVVFAVKPQVLQGVAEGVATVVQDRKPLVISIAAGIREPDLQGWLGGDVALVRTMPNTPALIQTGATGLYAGAEVSEQQRSLAESIMRAVGMTVWLPDEALLDVVTALSGSGPAYFFLIMEALEDAAVHLGLERETARLLTLQTTLGAARMAIESNIQPAALRERVTSPGGTTEKAIGALEESGIRETFRQALLAARDRSVELSTLLGKG